MSMLRAPKLNCASMSNLVYSDMSNTPRKRLNLVLSAADHDRLEHLRQIMGAKSATAVINLALETYELLLEQRAMGRDVVVRGAGGAEMLVPIRAPFRPSSHEKPA